MADEQAQVATSAETAAAAPQEAAGEPSSLPENLQNLSLEELNTFLTTGQVEVQAAGGDEGTAAAAPVVEPPAGEQPPAEPTAGAQPAPPTESAAPATEPPVAEPAAPAAEATPPAPPAATEPKRIRLGDRDHAIASVKKAADEIGEPITWAEAERRVVGEPAAPTPPAEPEPDLSETVETLAGEVQSIKDQLTELGSNEGLVTPEITKLHIELAEKTADLKLLQRDLRQAEAQADQERDQIQQASDTARIEARARVTESWPDANNRETPLGAAIAKRIAEMKNPKHPDHALLYTDSAPYRIARDVAEEMGVAPVVKTAAAATPPTVPPVTPPPTTAPAVPRPPVMSPASGAKTSVPPVQPAVDAKKTVEYLKTDASLQELDEFFGAGDMTKVLERVSI